MVVQQPEAFIGPFLISMDNAHPGVIDGAVGLIDPPAQIRIFQVQKILFIEASHFFKDLRSYEHEAAGQVGHLHHGIVIPELQLIGLHQRLEQEFYLDPG